MEHLFTNTSVVPAVHQIECHPWLQQTEFVNWHRGKGIHITQYSPFGNQNEIYGAKHLGKLIETPMLVEIGKKYGKSGAQVALGMYSFAELMNIRWLMGSSLGYHSWPFGSAKVQDTETYPGELTGRFQAQR